MARAKKKVVEVPTKEEAQELMREYADAEYDLTQTQGEMEKEIAAVREKYAEDIDALNSRRKECFDNLQVFAEHNREEFFSKKKSLEWTHGLLGFRIGQPKVKARKKFTLGAALELIIKNDYPWVRTKEEIDKEFILSLREDEEQMAKVSECGLEVVQDETFYIEPKREEVAA